jgi:hypothetical protein
MNVNPLRLEGKKVIITAAASGMGSDLAPTGTFHAVKRNGIPCSRKARSDLKRGTDCKPTDGLVALIPVRPQIRTAQQDSIRIS